MSPSMQSIAMLALSTAFFGQRAQAGSPASCSVTGSTPQSCQNTTRVSDLCCFNAPGGQLLQTQFWDTDPETGPTNSWTIHGLWPDKCDGSYSENCDSSRDYTGFSTILNNYGRTDLLDYMNTYWKNQGSSDEELWEHEWATHGTCISTFDTSCYTNYTPHEELVDFLNRTVSLFQSLPTYTWLSDAGITPSSSKTYTSSAILAALKAQHGANPVIQCSDNELDQVYYAFETKGSAQTGQFIPAVATGESSSCPSSGIKYPIKSKSSNKKRRLGKRADI